MVDPRATAAAQTCTTARSSGPGSSASSRSESIATTAHPAGNAPHHAGGERQRSCRTPSVRMPVNSEHERNLGEWIRDTCNEAAAGPHSKGKP